MKTVFASAAAILIGATASLYGASFDPLAVDPNFKPRELELTAHATERDLPLRIYLPA